MDTKLQQAITDIRAGNKKAGRQLLVEVLKANPKGKDAEAAWLWLSTLVSDPQKKRQCLEKVLKLNPDNQAAKKQLVKLDGKSDLLETSAVGESYKKCPYCAETVKAEAIVCRYCGKDLSKQVQSIRVPVETPALLDREIEALTMDGWQVVNRTSNAAQLRKPKKWDRGCLTWFVVLPLFGGFLYFPLFGIAIVALLIAAVDYALKQDETMYLTEDRLRQIQGAKTEKEREREERRRLWEERIQASKERKRQIREEKRKQRAARGGKSIGELLEQHFYPVLAVVVVTMVLLVVMVFMAL